MVNLDPATGLLNGTRLVIIQLREELAADQERVGKLFQWADASTWVSPRTIVSKALWQDQERLLEIHFPVHLLSGLPLHVACAVWREDACQRHRQRHASLVDAR